MVNLSTWYKWLATSTHVEFGGTETYSHFATALSDGLTRPCTSDDDLRAAVRQSLDEWPSISPGERDELAKSIVFLSLEDYRDKVGEARLRFETELVYA
jgi:hypothetical protein